jgi:hypothetical protein
MHHLMTLGLCFVHTVLAATAITKQSGTLVMSGAEADLPYHFEFKVAACTEVGCARTVLNTCCLAGCLFVAWLAGRQL